MTKKTVIWWKNDKWWLDIIKLRCEIFNILLFYNLSILQIPRNFHHFCSIYYCSTYLYRWLSCRRRLDTLSLTVGKVALIILVVVVQNQKWYVLSEEEEEFGYPSFPIGYIAQIHP